MFRLLLIVLSFASFPATCLAWDQIDDSGKYQIVVIGDKNSAPATWFDTDPGLKDVKAKVHFMVLTESMELYKQRYASLISGQKPLILFEQPDGGIVYAAAADTCPQTPQALLEALKHHFALASNAIPAGSAEQFADWCPDGQCPDGQCPDGQCPLPDQTRPRWRPDGGLFSLFQVEPQGIKDTLNLGAILVIAIVCTGIFIAFCIALAAASLAVTHFVKLIRPNVF